MCGIAGWIDWEQNLAKKSHILSAMVETLAARGPDAQGAYITTHAALGHRRLSVIDPVGGAQPMIRYRGDQKYVITYNGELYNTPELQQELEERGYTFTTHCDTEVLLVAFIEWGAACVEKFNGIYAFGIWDEKNQSLFLARDRIGVKPLFYAERGNSFIFGSELKTLLANPLVRPEIDEEGLAEVFMLGPARTPGNGVFRDVRELKPGYSLIYNRQGKMIKQYWALESKPHTDDFSTTKAKVRELLIDAASRQLVSDVPICTLLSGGLDSSALTALAAMSYKRSGLGKLDTYSVDYVDNELYFKASSFQPNADAPWVTCVSDHFDTSHHTILLDTPELAASLRPAALARDLPGMADIDTSLYLFCREIKKGATVALSGECADEIFGGYPWFQREHMINATTFPWSPNPEIRIPWLNSAVQERIKPAEYVAQRYSDALAEVPHLPGEEKRSARMREIFYLSLTRFMPTLLDRKDRMSMAFGLEVRVPFCDHRIVDYVWNVPWDMKNAQNREKGLLRYALEGILPENVLWRKKSPYPKTHNPAYTRAVVTEALRVLNQESSPLKQVLNINKLREIASADLSASNIPWFGQLMSGPQLFAYLIQADHWLREYKVKIV
ncbi:asparagine synthase (glutamine-hydrolyzing) [Sporomusa acidovorans]|uniref:asparagine synthase (glutamine-hydrolyzing) n=1 Tax=Sporomusa acidovorans (strain ATCC 49682 / DSM 3132 / Mol) TaxID=1123286 RepID=A0ABZ3IYI7_SPOA4|nr:asparagine synthase (glutamine-hydrolyzing) [Sporomusa acidovorans]OZC22092.1 asparagine synthetase 3 [Sporomusa acidovorans DSM 3132]SDF66237.1 asparagine synthase (glutamine-hydrolysing) [Sporomusa acidovorans]